MRLKTVAFVLMVTLVLGFGAATWAGVRLPWNPSSGGDAAPPPQPPLNVDLVEGMPHTLSVPEEVRTSLGIRKGGKDVVALAVTPNETRPLVLPGSTAFDPARLSRVRARFAPAEVVEIGKVIDRSTGRTEDRELRPGDPVRRGDVLGVFYSVDVGSKKNDLIDAIVQLKLDQEILERAESARGAVPPVFILNARRNVEGDRNAINRAVKYLETWNVPPEDIQAARKEAEEISKNNGKRDPEKEKQWARVELRAPDDGIIIERNVSLHEMVVDNTVNLFQIARVDRLLVLANAPEDDLPTLHELKAQGCRWTVRTAGAPAKKGITGPVDEIGYLIDANQHTAVVKGYIDNPEGLLRAGQYVTATIDLPPPKGVVEIPMRAVADDGKQCLVFVQKDPQKPHYTLRRVKVTHRFDKTAYVSTALTKEESQLTPKEKEQGMLPLEPLQTGDRVLTSGILELKKELEDRESGGGQGS
jgi:cobalt-zinc-cadmium efflux system membrane fusion protein